MTAACSRCGATIDPLALACPYCELTTPAGVAAHQRAEAEARARATWDAQAAERARAVAQQAVDKSAMGALLWSIAGMVLCCLPVGAVGALLGLRARSAASRAGVLTPAKAIAAMVIGVLSMLTSFAFATYVIYSDAVDHKTADTRIAALEASTKAAAASGSLDHPTACALAELHVRRNGFRDERGYMAESFECNGELHVLGGGIARLEDLRFRDRDSEEKRFEAAVCFKRGAAWYVTSVGEPVCR